MRGERRREPPLRHAPPPTQRLALQTVKTKGMYTDNRAARAADAGGRLVAAAGAPYTPAAAAARPPGEAVREATAHA